MAQSYVTFTGNGSSTGPITLGFNYILKAHVKVYQTRDILANTGTLLSETTHYTFNTAGTQISMVTAPANGVVITVERQTPNDDQIVPYADGSNLIADSLNNSDKQTLFCTQELEDRQELSAAKADAAKTAADTATSNVTTLTGTQFKTDGSVAMTGNINANSNKVINVTDPTNAQDAVTKAYLERSGSIASAQILDGTIVDGDVNASAAISGSKLQASSGSNAGSMSSAHYTKLEGIEASATADQSATEIKSSYESNSDTNAYTDAEKTKLSGIETSATADQSASEIKSSYESNSNTNAFTDANKTLVDAISATATEINYTTNVTSDIQSQINNKQPLDSELTTLSGMTSATASKLAAGTNLTSDIADLNQIDGLTKQTTISDSDASFPTSGAVVDYVAAQISPLGGLEVVATEVAFPNTQPASGVVISISDAGGVVINGSGVSTTGRTVGGATITINGFPSSLHSETLVAGVGLMVSSTGSSQTYNYHKILGKEDDIKQLSDDINDFNARYRVGSSNPSSALDAGDLFFNTSTSKLLVYNATNTAWEEAQSIGNFYISTLSPAFNGSLQDFTITNAPTNAEQILLSINGVIQKPNAGSSTPSEGFALSGNTVKLGAAPASTDTYFAVVIGSTVNIGTPSNNTVSSAIIQNGAVTGEKIATNLDLADNKKIRFGTGNDLEIYHDGSHSFLKHTTTGYLRLLAAGNGVSIANDDQSEAMAYFLKDGAVQLYYDNSKKLETGSGGIAVTGYVNLLADGTNSGGSLYLPDSNGNTSKINVGTGNDLQIYHDGSHSFIRHDGGGSLLIKTDAADEDIYIDAGQSLHLRTTTSFESAISCIANGTVELYYDNSKKFNTASTGCAVTGTLWADYVKLEDDGEGRFGSGNDLTIYHDGTDSYIKNATGELIIRSSVDRIRVRTNDFLVKNNTNTENFIYAVQNGSVELYYDAVKRLETTSDGAHLVNDLNIYSDSDKDEGHIKLEALGSGVDDDRVWIGTRNSDTSHYNFAVDGWGQVWSYSSHHSGRIKNNSSSPTYTYIDSNYLGYRAYQGIEDQSAYRASIFCRTATPDWDDRRVFYYVDSTSSTTAVDYDQDQTISFSGSGRGNFKAPVWAGRVESDESNPNSVYAGSEVGFVSHADDNDDQTYIYARNVADTSFVFYSEVNDEPNVEIEADGSARTDGTWSDTNADYAECFEWTDGNGSAEERRGMTVVLDGEKVKLATDSDNKDNIIGVVSPEPVILGDAAPLGWHGRYKKDVYGSPIRKEQEWLVWKKEYHYEDGVKVLCAQPDPNKPQTLNTCERIRVENIEREKAKGLIPDFAITNNIRYKTYGKDIDKTDYDPSKPYVPRKDRKEWDAIGMVGKLVVRRGQPVGTRWLLMKENIGTDTDGTVLDRYLVR